LRVTSLKERLSATADIARSCSSRLTTGLLSIRPRSGFCSIERSSAAKSVSTWSSAPRSDASSNSAVA
jgi:hypothetical protein